MKPLKGSHVAHVGLLALLAALLSSCGRGLPSKLDRLPAGLNNTELKASGIYGDAWVGESGSINLKQPSGQQVLSIRGTVPKIADARFRTAMELRMDDKAIAHWNIGLGDFALSAPVFTGGGTRRVTIAFDKSQPLPGGDGRMVGARLSFIGFEPASAKTGNPSDIVRSLNLQLGGGWGVLETFDNETFRWVNNDALIALTADQSGSAVLSVIVEPGPGVGSKPFVFRVLDAAGRQVGAQPVEKRSVVRLILPVESGKSAEFRLHVDGGGKPARNDPRILNFRVFEIEAAPWKAGK